uniref:Uncharacterized protein n=1 Tax=Arundo donax TaxID=35708 RepID=A0A0A9C386_ARUDO
MEGIGSDLAGVGEEGKERGREKIGCELEEKCSRSK